MPNPGEYRTQSGQSGIQQALARGQARGLVGTAIYLPGEDVRCPGLRPGTTDQSCGGYLFTAVPDFSVYARVAGTVFHDPERRKVPRVDDRCPRCRARVAVELIGTAAA